MALSTALTTLGVAAAAAEKAEKSGGDGVAVSALAKAKSSGKPVEITEHRTPYAEVHANPSGTLTVTTHLTPVRVRQGRTWVPVDTDLVTDKGRVRPKAAVTGLELSSGGDGPLVRLNDKQHVLEMSWPEKLPKPRLDGPVATYPEVLPGVDLQVTAEAEGFQQLLVVKDAKAARNPKLKKIAYGLTGTGLKIGADRNKGLTAVDARGKTVFSGPAPRMWDSSKGNKKTSVMPAAVSGKTLEITPDQKLLTGPDTVYPVHVDPSFSTGVYGAWQVSEAYPDTVWRQEGMFAELTTAAYWSTGSTVSRTRSLLQVDVPYLGGQVLNAKLVLQDHATYSGDCSLHPVELWHTGRAGSTTTWNNQPEWKTKNSSYACPKGTVTLDATGAAQAASLGDTTVVDLGLRASDTVENRQQSSLRRFLLESATFTAEVTYNGECLLVNGVDHKDTDGTSFTKEMNCESQASDVRVEPYTSSAVTGQLLAGPHSFLCWRSGDMNAAGNRIWYYVKGDTSSGWTDWQGWGYVPADKITGAGAEPFPGLPACQVHNVTPGLMSPWDFNSDGRSDVVALQADGNLALFAGNGNGTLANKTMLWTDGRGRNYLDVFTADFNTDGIADIAAVDSAYKLWWWPGDGNGGVADAAVPATDPLTNSQTYFRPYRNVPCRDFFSLDYNGDGKTDVGAVCRVDEQGLDEYQYWWFTGDGKGGVNGLGSDDSGPGGATPNGSHTSADFFSDGRPDVAEMDGFGRLWLNKNIGGGELSPLAPSNPWPAADFGSTVSQMFSGDFDGDRKGDVAAVDSAGRLWMWPGDGNGGFGTPSKMSTATDWGSFKDLM
ncbi:FG-GAP-like repeat-containing protein [Streptomyces sannanensis]|uniref:FG-GAP-like repeat-containing protein n=1 Tax=Streptomyces sannanensis TaxID=285536 RepID=UPI0031E752B2